MNVQNDVLPLLLVAVVASLLFSIRRARRQARQLAASNAALHGREAMLKQILDATSVAIFLVDMQGRIVQANERMAQMFGQPVGALVGSEYAALLHPSERASGERNVHLVIDGVQSALAIVRRYRRADQSEFWGRVSVRQYFDADGRATGAVGEIADVTASKQAEEALTASEFLWKFAIEGAGDGVWDWNIVTDQAAYSTRWKTMLGYADDDILPTNDEWKTRIHPDDRQRVAAAMQDYLAARTSIYVVEYRLRCKDGSYKWILGRGMIVARDAAGNPLRMIGTHTDISERKAMEEQIRQMAFYDALTGLPNRRLLLERLGLAMAASKRSGHYGALMFIDLDNFKPLNDAHGHGAGDLLLAEVAERLARCVREVDTVARFGGDEFVVVLGELAADRAESAEQADSVAEKIRKAVAVPYRLELPGDDAVPRHIEHRCTASIGVTLFIDHQSSPDEIIKRADAAMYLAKDAGRDTLRFC